MGKKRPASPVCSENDTKKKKKKKESDLIKKERHKHKKHSHTTTKKHSSNVDSKASHHNTITLDNIPDSLLPHRSLINYVDDRSKLLDEVFSIFSEEEISNMLPDILKGIRLEEVQKLCYEQLKAMEVAAIKQIIQSLGDNSSHSSSKANDISSNEDEAKVITCDQCPAPHEPSQQITEGSELQVATKVPSKNSPDVVESSSAASMSNLLSDKQSTIGDENCSTNVMASDTSNVMECSGTNEDSIELLPAAVGDDIDRELTLCPAPSAQEHDSTEQVVAVTRHLASTDSSNISETAVLAELQMRKRALQSQLKKQQLEKKKDEQRTKEELLLRQKALQSLLAANVAKKANK